MSTTDINERYRDLAFYRSWYRATNRDTSPIWADLIADHRDELRVLVQRRWTARRASRAAAAFERRRVERVNAVPDPTDGVAVLRAYLGTPPVHEDESETERRYAWGDR